MESQSSSDEKQLQDVLLLLKLKNDQPEDMGRDQRFLVAATAFLETRSKCMWCRYTAVCGELLRLFSFQESPPLIWFRTQTVACLTSCRACIEAYYGARPRLFASFRKVYSEVTVRDFERQMQLFDVARLREPFEHFLADNDAHRQAKIKYCLFEVLLFPGWVVSEELGSIFEQTLVAIIASKRMIKLSERLPGVIVCAAHPNDTIRDWARSVLESKVALPAAKYNFVNCSWDTVLGLGKGLPEKTFLDCLSVSLKASSVQFIKTTSNWNWVTRISVALQDANLFAEALRAYTTFLSVFLAESDTDWSRFPGMYDAIEYIFGNPSFAVKHRAASSSFDWIALTVSLFLHDHSFRHAHRLMSCLMNFVRKEQVSGELLVIVMTRFASSLIGKLRNSYLLNKLCQLLFFLLERCAGSVRERDAETQLAEACAAALGALIRADLLCDREDSLTGKVTSAVFDPSCYHKYCTALEKRAVSASLLGAISDAIVTAELARSDKLDAGFWNVRTSVLSFFVNECATRVDLLKFSDNMPDALVFVHLCAFRLVLRTVDLSPFWQRLLQTHPDKCVRALERCTTNLLTRKYMRTDGQIPLDRTLHFYDQLARTAFAQDTSILSVYPDRHQLVLDFVTGCAAPFYASLGTLITLPGGVVYYELSRVLASFVLLLLSLAGGEEVFRHAATSTSAASVSTSIAKMLAACLSTIMQRTSQPKGADIPVLASLSDRLLVFCGHLKTDLNAGKVAPVLRALMTSTVAPETRHIIFSAVSEYNRLSGRAIAVSVEPVKTRDPSKLDPAVLKRLSILEQLEDDLLARSAEAASRTGTSVASKPTSKLGQMRQELVRETGAMGPPSRKPRFAPAIVAKAPRLMSRADLEKTRAESSESDSDAEISSELFKDAALARSVAVPPPRSVKLIAIDGGRGDETERTDSRHGQTIVSKHAQMQRDWQAAKRLHRFVLSLDYDELSESSLTGVPVRPIPDTFASYDAYFQAFEPLLQLECRSQITQAKEEADGRAVYHRSIVQTVSVVDDFHELTLNFGDDAAHRLFGDQDLLVGHPVTHHRAPNEPLAQILGLVTLTSSRMSGFEVTIRMLMRGRQEADFQLAARPKQAWKFAKLCNLVTNGREFLALLNLSLFSNVERILRPQFVPLDAELGMRIDAIQRFYCRNYGLNDSQARAIGYALVNRNFFTLIQGPPGTGKTRTIEGFLAALFGRPSPDCPVRPTCKRVLICAPSNAAIDEIVRRIKVGVRDSYGQRIAMRTVRVGSQDMIHEDVRELSVDCQVEALVQEHIASAVEMLETHKTQLAELKRKLDASEEADSDGAEGAPATPSLKTQLWQVKEHIRKGTKFIEDSRHTLRAKVLTDAQVVCCTLSASGHEQLAKLDLDFELVIIDEACQAVEPSSLIPLQYGCKRAVLIGDPNQLPPTVLSQTAAAFTYEQSLFQRLQKIDPTAVQLLSVQYRMHPAISVFPSAYFYDGRLRDGPHVQTENTRPWHQHRLLGPCRFFDVPGQEQMRAYSSGRQGKSAMNEMEARIAAILVALVAQAAPTTELAGKIGIITPYKEQRRLISRELVRRFGAGILQSVEVSTVDGYQGQEREVIIFSCVRTGGRAGGIGFLNDSRRLNVAITRAKCSLFLLGKSAVLGQTPLWHALISDAKQRDMFIPFDERVWRDNDRVGSLANLQPRGNVDGRDLRQVS